MSLDLNPYEAPAAPVLEVVARRTADLPLASRTSRFCARFLDNLLLYLPPGCVYLAGVIATGGGENGDHPQLVIGLAAGVAFLLYLAELGWFLWMLSQSGQTPGKRAAGIRIVAADGGPADIWTIALMRMFLPTVIGGLCSLFGLVDSLAILGEEKRCIHDRLANTAVVDAGWVHTRPT